MKNAAIRGVFVLEILFRILSGVEYAHDKNMLISYSVSDFNICRKPFCNWVYEC
jgi:hypothetical protein